MIKKAFIFDLDGVIVDTAKYHYLAWKSLAKNLGIDFSETQNEQLKGVSRVDSLKKILQWGNISLSENEFTELLNKKNTDYLEYIVSMDAEEILPGVVKTLDHLKKEKQAIGLGSASKNARTILKKVELFNDFQVIVDGNDITNAKPDPEVFLKAVQQLNIKPQQSIIFEDSVAGIQAAKLANMTAIGIGDKDILSEADYVFSDFTEISTHFIDTLIKN